MATSSSKGQGAAATSSKSRRSSAETNRQSLEVKSVFPPGFERDTKALLMLREYGVITRAEVRENIQRLSVELHPDPEYVVPQMMENYLYEDSEEYDYDVQEDD
jgi:hypothetical protein